MGFFSKDWSKEIDRAETLLGEGALVRALELARRAEAKTEGGLALRASTVVGRARAALLASVLANAAAAEAEGNLADAADWLLAAVDHAPDAGQAAQIEARRAALLDRLDQEEGEFIDGPEARVGEGGALDSTSHYEMLVDTLTEELAPRYAGRPREFQLAFVHLNEGRAEEALELLEPLLARSPEDAVLRLEAGRARLLAGDAAAAREDLEVAWRELGDGALDVVSALSAPALWAEACLAAGAAAEAVERLRPLAEPTTGDSEVCRLFAEALIACGRHEEARTYLESLVPLLPAQPEFSHLLAQVLAASGEIDRAVAGLERAVAPSCSGGGCGAPAPHLPSLRTLAQLHIARGRDLDRARELMAIVASRRRGQLGAADYEVLERLYRVTGDVEAADTAAGEARRLAALGEEAVSAAPALLGGKGRAL